MTRLADVTLLIATSVEIDEAHDTLLHCARQMQFGAVKMISSEPPRFRAPDVQYVTITSPGFLGYRGYQRFMVEQLGKHVTTSHCLVIQSDGFILDPARWQDEFLAYDYIGAPWPERVGVYPENWILMFDKNRVGNGGFSFRSKKLLDITARLN